MYVPFCPHEPTPKQRHFLARLELEVFFGGAAGGGKSVALLMGALQYALVPGYSALILRKDLPRLSLAGGLIPRSHEWLARCRKAKWNASRRQWSFATGGAPATITFGYLARPLDKFRYASSEFQYIAFDELTDFTRDDYLFLFSRLRKPKTLYVPLRIRSASNPGGAGHQWVRERFIPDPPGRGPATSGRVPNGSNGAPGFYSKSGRIYIPSRIADNPALDEAQYRRALAHLPPVERERLMNGDWNVQADGLFRPSWLRYFSQRNGQLELFDGEGRSLATVPGASCHRFVTIDPAGTAAERTREARGHAPCWSVIQVWDRPACQHGRYLLLRHQVRERMGFDKLCRTIAEIHRQWEPERLWIEGDRLGQAAIDALGHCLPLEPIASGGKDKVARAAPLLLKFERGEVFLPQDETTWRPAFEAELLAWTGTNREASDQIDAAAYAAQIVNHFRLDPIILPWDAVRLN